MFEMYCLGICKNCKTSSPTTICSLCINLPQCTKCRRYLRVELFKSGDGKCDTCHNTPIRSKYALNGVVEEHQISINSPDYNSHQQQFTRNTTTDRRGGDASRVIIIFNIYLVPRQCRPHHTIKLYHDSWLKACGGIIFSVNIAVDILSVSLLTLILDW